MMERVGQSARWLIMTFIMLMFTIIMVTLTIVLVNISINKAIIVT